MGKQAFVNTCYLQSFMKTNTCPRGKEKVRLYYVPWYRSTVFKKEKVYEKVNFCEFQNVIPYIFLLQIERNPTPCSHEFAGDRKNLLASAFRWHRPNQSNDLFSAFCHSSFFGNFLCLFIFSAWMPIVCTVCLFNIFLLLFSNKMKSSFLFYGEMK